MDRLNAGRVCSVAFFHEGFFFPERYHTVVGSGCEEGLREV